MKRNIFFSLLALVLVVICVQAEPVVHYAVSSVQTAVDGINSVDTSTILMMGAPALVSSKVTPDLIKQLKVKFGTIKIIKVTVEPVVYDIDKLGYGDKRDFATLGLGWAIIYDANIPIEERLKELNKLKEIVKEKDGENKALAKVLLAKYKGEIVDKGEHYEFLVRRPDRSLIKMLLPLAEQGKIDDFADKAIKNLVIGGEIEALEDGLVYMGVVSQLQGLIKPAASFLKKA